MPRLRSGHSSAIVSPTSLLLLAALLRLSGLARDQRFHPDEALYADLSRRVGLWGDWQLLHVTVDKPPLFNFVGGLFYRLLGDSELTTRLPNTFASLLLLALLFTLTKRLTRSHPAAHMALLIVALSPMEIALASSGFVDTQLILWLLLALVLISYGRWGASGIALGLGFAVKPMFWLIPLVIGVGMALDAPRLSSQKLVRWCSGVGLILLLITLWDLSGEPVGIWSLGGQNSVPKDIAALDELIPRAKGWLAWAWYLLPLAAWGVLLLAGCYHVFKHQKTPPLSPLPVHREGKKAFLPIIGVALYIVAYALLHWLVKFNVYDRYLLPLVPLVAVIMGVAMASLPRRIVIMCAGIILITGIPLAWAAVQGHTPIASDGGRHQGIDGLAAVMNEQYAGEVFYEHWLGWELRYYLGAEPQVIHLWFADPMELVAYAQEEFAEFPGVTRYFVGTKDEAAQWIDPIERQNIATELIYDDGRFVIYRLAERLR